MATKKKQIKKQSAKMAQPAVELKLDNIVIPANVGEVSACCDKHSSRYALEGFRLQVKADGSYEAAATDSECLALLRGKRVEVPFTTTTHRSGIDTSKQFDAILSPKDWKAAVAYSGDKEKMIGVTKTGNAVTLVCDDKRSMQTRAIEGKFPNCASVIPTTRPVVSVIVNCKLLAKLATLAAKFSGDERLTLEIREAEGAIVFRAENVPEEQEFIGLLMPCKKEQ